MSWSVKIKAEPFDPAFRGSPQSGGLFLFYFCIPLNTSIASSTESIGITSKFT
jgi:hypothetical protein